MYLQLTWAAHQAYPFVCLLLTCLSSIVDYEFVYALCYVWVIE